MVERFEVGKTYRDSVGYVVDCLWAGDTVDEDGQLVAVRCSDGSQDAGRYITARWTEVKPLPPFPPGWGVLWSDGDVRAGFASRAKAKEFAGHYSALDVVASPVALVEYDPETRSSTYHEVES